MQATDNSISVLNNLIETCKDGENGFRQAAEAVKNMKLRSLFEEYSQERLKFAHELQADVSKLGRTPEKSGSVSAAAHRGWMNIKSVVTGADDHAILAECERGEDSAKEAYQNALKEMLPTDIKSVVERQYERVKKAHDHIRDLRDKSDF